MATLSRLGGRALAALLPDVRTLPGPVYVALARAVTQLVLDGRVTTETRLPSERELATALSCSRATVTAAYDALRADGYLTSRTGSGSYVTVPPGSQPRSSLSRWTVRGTAGTHPGPGGIADGAGHSDVIDLSCAALPAPPGLIEAALGRAAAGLGPYLHTDGYDPAGLPVLREALAARFTARGVPTRADQILVTNGALHGFDLVLRLLVGPGDRVVTELPTYPGALDAVRANNARVVPVPMAPGGGWQLDQLQATLRQTAARVAYLVPDFHNPTGALMPADARRDALRVARQTGTTVVVDESFVDLSFGDTELPAAAIDASVVTLGSLSKPVWGGLRIGWLRASTDLVHRLAALRTTIDMAGPVIDQLVAAELTADLDAVTAARLAVLRPQRDALVAALARELPQWRTAVPQGGLSLWAELDAPLSTPLTMLAAHAGVIAVPGSRFGVDGTLERFLRLPFSLPVGRLEQAVARLAGVWHELGTDRLATRHASTPLVVA